MRASIESLRDWGLTVGSETHVWWGTGAGFARHGGFQVVFRADEDAITYGRGEFLVPRRFFFLWGTPATAARLTMDMAVERGELVCKSLLIQPIGNDEAITTSLLRKLPLRRIIEEVAGPRAAFRLVQKPGGGLERRPAILTDAGKQAWTSAYEKAAKADVPRRGKRVTDERLERVAEIYLSAKAQGQHPTQSVVTALNTSRSNASRWVAEARRRGLLEPATKTKGDSNA